jgi:hypothetical protein
LAFIVVVANGEEEARSIGVSKKVPPWSKCRSVRAGEVVAVEQPVTGCCCNWSIVVVEEDINDALLGNGNDEKLVSAEVIPWKGCVGQPAVDGVLVK